MLNFTTLKTKNPSQSVLKGIFVKFFNDIRTRNRSTCVC